jgi:hypothetical protein
MLSRNVTQGTAGSRRLRIAQAAGLAAALLVAWGPSGARAADVSTSPARAVAFERRHFDNKMVAGVATIAQIVRAKPRQVLTITAAANTYLNTTPTQNLMLTAKFNGQWVGEPFGYFNLCGPGTNTCSVNGTWVIDLDQAELENPGTVLDQPIDVEVYTNDGYSNTATALDVTTVVRMEKKK